MVEVKQVGWDSRRQEFMEALFKAAKKGGPWPFNIVSLNYVLMRKHYLISDSSGYPHLTPQFSA